MDGLESNHGTLQLHGICIILPRSQDQLSISQNHVVIVLIIWPQMHAAMSQRRMTGVHKSLTKQEMKYR